MIEFTVWQDIYFMLAGWAFGLLVYPILRDEDASVPRWSSVPTATLLYGHVIAFTTLGLYLSALGSLLTALMWTALAIWKAPSGGSERGVVRVDTHRKI